MKLSWKTKQEKQETNDSGVGLQAYFGPKAGAWARTEPDVGKFWTRRGSQIALFVQRSPPIRQEVRFFLNKLDLGLYSISETLAIFKV